MKPERALIVELEKDLRLSPTGKVLYLEGYTDVPVFLGLVGHPLPETIDTEGLAVDGVWIRGLGARQGSGGQQVRRLVRVAHERAYGPIRGLIDGDGEAYDALISGFREPGEGNPHRWPVYCIENWLPQSGWPPDWGNEPEWLAVLDGYLPYAALNRVVVRVQQHLASSGVAKHAHPTQGPLETVAQVRAKLAGAEASPLAGTDLVAAFDDEVERCRSALASSPSHGHALINGKWLVDHHACAVTGNGREHCRRRWSSHVAERGGHPMVREWWEHFVRG